MVVFLALLKNERLLIALHFDFIFVSSLVGIPLRPEFCSQGHADVRTLTYALIF